MTKIVLVSQRVDVVASYGERRDALDQRWAGFLADLGYLAVPVPNHPAAAALAAALDFAAVLLSGGNDPADLGGDAPERDAAEDALIAAAARRRRPVLGVCRGAQFLALRHGARLARAGGHVAVRHPVTVVGARPTRIVVNSYHNWVVQGPLPAPLEMVASADDGTVEAFRHAALPLAGVMWHPEREPAAAAADHALVARFFADGVFDAALLQEQPTS